MPGAALKRPPSQRQRPAPSVPVRSHAHEPPPAWWRDCPVGAAVVGGTGGRFCLRRCSSAVAATRSLEISSRCIGQCEPRLVALTPDRLMALWTDNTGRMFAQAIDARGGALVGPRNSLGFIAIDEEDHHLA